MNKGKYARGNSRKALLVLLALVLVIGCTVGGTLAWLTVSTKEVTNTFVVGDIGTLTLTEAGATTNDATGNASQQFTIVPGVDLAKNPVVTYKPSTSTTDVDVPVYVFVKVETKGWTVSNKDYSIKNNNVTWSIGSEWNEVVAPIADASDVTTAVYYVAVDAEADKSIADFNKAIMAPIDGSSVTNATIYVSGNIAHGDVESIAAAAGNIKFTAYAIQQDGLTDANAAWTALNP